MERNCSFGFGQMADNVNMVLIAGDVGDSDIRSTTDRARGLDAGAGRISLLLGPIGLA